MKFEHKTLIGKFILHMNKIKYDTVSKSTEQQVLYHIMH